MQHTVDLEKESPTAEMNHTPKTLITSQALTSFSHI